MIIFGWGHRTARNFGPVRKIQCSNCNNETNWHLQKLTTWVTLFFIPVIPYHTDYLMVCPVCRCCVETNREDFEQLKGLVHSSNDKGYTQSSPQVDSILNEAGAVRRTETQINFIRQMKEIEKERERVKSEVKEDGSC